MALVATRKFSLGDQALAPGARIDPEVVAQLPRGRMETLKRAGLVRDDQAPDLAEELAELRGRVEALEAKRGPGRPRKEEAA